MTEKTFFTKFKTAVLTLMLMAAALVPITALNAQTSRQDPHWRDIRQNNALITTAQTQSTPGSIPVLPNLPNLQTPNLNSLFNLSGQMPNAGILSALPGGTPAASTNNKQGANQSFTGLIKTACSIPNIQSMRKNISVTYWSVSSNKVTTPKNLGAGTTKTLDDICGQINSTSSSVHLGQINFQY